MNAAEKTSTSRSPAFVSTVESSDIHDPMAMSGVDARYGVSISPGILTDNAPLSSQVPVPLSPRLSGRQLRPKSPSRNFEQALAAVNRKARSKRFVMPPVSWSNEKYYLNRFYLCFANTRWSILTRQMHVWKIMAFPWSFRSCGVELITML